jgi:pyruvate formate lyase activating enzyme
VKGIIFDIRRFATHDGPGIRTTVFFKGCPLSCPWCHNPESIDSRPFKFQKKVMMDDEWFAHEEWVGRGYTVDEVLQVLLRDKVFYEESGGGVTFSGGEPLLQPEFLAELLEACQREGLHTAVDTCGQVHRKFFDLIIPFTSLFLFDFKHFDAAKHLLSTGFSNDIIRANLQTLLKSGKPVHVRIPVIPCFNHNENDMAEMMLFLKSLDGKIGQVDLLPYHTLGNNKYKRFDMPNPMDGIPGLKKNDLLPYLQVFQNGGFKVTIGG